jgi:hypothetical protein
MRVSNLQMQNDNVGLLLQLGSSGTADAGANYTFRGSIQNNIFNASLGTNLTSFTLQSANGTSKNGISFDIAAPFLSAQTFYYSTGFANYSGGAFYSGMSGMLNTTTSYTDMFFSSNSGNTGPFTFALFGYAK